MRFLPRHPFATALTLAGFLLCALAVHANPVPDETAKDFNALPGQVVEGVDKAAAARLQRYFGLFGIDLLDPGTLQYMDRHFNAIKPIMVASQRPPMAPRYRLQDWYRARAQGADRDSMMSALRAWLTAPVHQAPQGGMMRTTWPPEAVEREILTTRVAAAEFLSDWQDRSALPQLRALAAQLRARPAPMANEFEPDLALGLSVAIQRIEDPSHAGFLVANERGGFDLHRSLAEVRSMELRASNDRPWLALDSLQTREVWSMLSACRPAPASNWEGGPCSLRIQFQGGLRAEFWLTEPGRVTYHDNARATYRPTIKLLNAALHDDLVSRVDAEARALERAR